MSEAREQAAPAAEVAAPVPEPTGPGTAVAAQEQLRASERPPSTILTEQPAAPSTSAQEEKPTEAAPEAPAPFDAEKITFPDGFQRNEELFGKFSEIAKAGGLNQPVAQQLADLYATAAKAVNDASRTAWNTTLASWETEVRGDPVIAKETLRTSEGVLTGLDAVKARVGRLLDNPALTHPRTREALEVTGIGSHLALIHSLNNYAKALEESGLVEGNGPAPMAGRQPSTRPDAAAALYPNNPRGGV